MGLQQPLPHVVERPGIALAQAGLAGAIQQPAIGNGAVGPVGYGTGAGVIGKEVVEAGAHLETAAVAVALHPCDPAGIQEARADHLVELPAEGPYTRTFRPGVVAEPDGRTLPPQCRYRCTQPALKLVVVVGIQQVVLAVVLVVQHRVHRAQPLAQPLVILRHLQRPVAVAAVAPLAPGEEGPGQIAAVVPFATLDQPLEPSTVGTWCRPVNRAQTVAGGLLQPLSRHHHQAHEVGEGVAEQTGDAQGDVHPRAAQQGVGDHLQVHHAAAVAIPHRSHTHQRQGLGDLVAAVAHRRRTPHAHGQMLQMLTLLLHVLLQEQRRGPAPQAPCRFRGQPPQIHAVEVATRRQHLRPAAGRRTGRSGRDALPGQCVEQRRLFPPGTGVQPGCHVRLHASQAAPGGRSWQCCRQHLLWPFPRWQILQKHQRPGFQQRHGITGTAGGDPQAQPPLVSRCERCAFLAAPGIQIQRQVLGHRLGKARLATLGAARQGHEQLQPLPGGGLGAIAVQTGADLGFLEFTEVAVSLLQLLVQAFAVHTVAIHPEVKGRQGIRQRLPQDRDPVAAQLSCLPVLVQQLLQLLLLAMQPGTGQGRREVVENHGLAAPLRLGALARIVHDEGVEVGQGTHGQIREARLGQAHTLARQPLQVAVFAEMHHRMGAVNGLQPVVGGQVVVGGRQLGAVVAQLRIPFIPAAGLDQHHHGTEAAAMDAEPVRLQQRVGRRWPPAVQHRLPRRFRNVGEPALIGRQRQVGQGPERLAGGIVAATGRQLGDEVVTIGRQGRFRTNPVAGHAEPAQARRHTGGGIQPHAVGQAAVAGWVVGQHDGEATVRWRQVRQLQPGTRPAGGPLQPRGNRHQAKQGAVQLLVALLHLLERHHPPQQPPVQLR